MRRTFVEKSLYLSTLKNVNIVKFWDFTQSPARLTDNYLVSYCHSWTSLYGPFVCMTSFLLSQVIFQHRNSFLWLEIYFEYRLSLYIASLFIPPLSLYRLSLYIYRLPLYTASLFIPPIVMPDPWMAVLGGLTEQTRTFNTLSKSVTFDIFWRNIILLHDKLRVYFGFTLFWFILVNCNH